MKNALISIAVPTYNVEPYIQTALQSALNQQDVTVEVFVIDDASTDNTLQRVREIDDPRVTIIPNDVNRGPGYCRNLAIKRMRGDWLALLDGDDWWDPFRLSHLLRLAERWQAEIAADNNFLVVDGQTVPWSTTLREMGCHQRVQKLIRLDDLLKFDYSHLQPLISARFIREHQLYYPWYSRIAEDFTFMLTFLQYCPRMVVTPTPYYYYRTRKGSVTSDSAAYLPQTLEAIRTLTAIDAGSSDQVARILKARKALTKKTTAFIHFRDLIHTKSYSQALREAWVNPKSFGYFLLLAPKAARRVYLKRMAAYRGKANTVQA